jgi:S-disulfanyl-L-cysteine oxidoreductase SoxD
MHLFPALTMALIVTALAVGTFVSAAAQEAATRSVWDGVYTERQAARGALAYASNCSRCHGDELQGGTGKPLVGDGFWRDFQARTVDYLHGYMAKNMPNGAPATLAPDVYLDLTAFILSRNAFPTGSTELTAASAVGVQIIQKGGSSELPVGALGRVVGCLAKSGRDYRVNRATTAERTEGRPVAGDATRALGTRTFPLQFVITSLDNMVGHRVVVTGILMGQGGSSGINVTQVDSLSSTCQ